MSKTSHYKATTKRGFEAGELAGLLASHSPTADYKVVISIRGKVRELIVTEDTTEADAIARVYDRDAAACLPPADDQRHGGKLEATLHPELTDESLNARFGDPRLSNLDRRDGLKWPASEDLPPEAPVRWDIRPASGRTRFAGRANDLRAAQGLPPLTPDEEAKWERILDEDAKRRTRYLEGH